MVHRKPAKGACIAVRENEFQTFESHKDKEISLLFKQFAKKTTKKPRLFHLKTAMSDGFAEKEPRLPFFSKSRIYRRGDEPRLPLFSKSRIYRIHQIAARGKPAIGDGVLWITFTFAVDLEISPCKRGEAEAQLGDSEARAVSLEGSVVARIHR